MGSIGIAYGFEVRREIVEQRRATPRGSAVFLLVSGSICASMYLLTHILPDTAASIMLNCAQTRDRTVLSLVIFRLLRQVNV